MTPKYEALWQPKSRKPQGKISKLMVAVVVKNTREQTYCLQGLCLLCQCLPHCLEEKVWRGWEYLHVTVFSESTQTNSKVKEISGKWIMLRSLKKSHQFLCVMDKKIPETHIRKAVLWTGKKKSVNRVKVMHLRQFCCQFWGRPQARAFQTSRALVSSSVEQKQQSLPCWPHRCWWGLSETLDTSIA